MLYIFKRLRAESSTNMTGAIVNQTHSVYIWLVWNCRVRLAIKMLVDKYPFCLSGKDSVEVISIEIAFAKTRC